MPTEIRDIMIQNVKTASVEDTVLRAAEIMNRNEIGCIIVTDAGKPAGILTERDILKRVVFKRRDPEKTRVREVMSKPLVTVGPHITITQAAQMMIKAKIKKLAVTNADHLVGILSLTDLMPLLESQRVSLKGAPKRVKKIFEIYYDPKRQIRKNCPLTMGRGMAVACLASKCMWYVTDRCVFLNLAEKISQ